MNTASVLIGIGVGTLTILGVFIKLAFQMGAMAQQLKNVVQALEDVTEQVKQLFEWRYESAVRNQKGRGRLPSD